jgi:transcriptional regulator with XRE-family HTH domain
MNLTYDDDKNAELARKYGADLRNKRKILGLTQVEFARLVESSAGTISRFENGKFIPSAPMCDTIFTALENQRRIKGIPLDDAWKKGE